VLAILQESEARRVLDLGCGEGQFLEKLVGDRRFVEIVGVDVSARSLERAALRLKLDERADNDRQRLRLLQSSLMYKDRRLQGYDAAVLNEVIEHIEPSRLGTVERTLFREARPLLVIITTPNREYNRLWPSLPAGQFRHRDHRFEWTREEFRGWVERVARETGYRAEIAPVGPQDPQAGPPTQMGIFRR
jgi:3' terminal RNA ribose 2'-O-methyltransferase Hen1